VELDSVDRGADEVVEAASFGGGGAATGTELSGVGGELGVGARTGTLPEGFKLVSLAAGAGSALAGEAAAAAFGSFGGEMI
jgi:hypothetical protein